MAFNAPRGVGIEWNPTAATIRAHRVGKRIHTCPADNKAQQNIEDE
jgi:hypothetical protein